MRRDKGFSSFPIYCKNLKVSIHEYILGIIKHLMNIRKGHQNREAGISECHPNSSHDKRSQGWAWNYARLHVWAVFCLLVLAPTLVFVWDRFENFLCDRCGHHLEKALIEKVLSQPFTSHDLYNVTKSKISFSNEMKIWCPIQTICHFRAGQTRLSESLL